MISTTKDPEENHGEPFDYVQTKRTAKEEKMC
jgi:hypothetical protein